MTSVRVVVQDIDKGWDRIVKETNIFVSKDVYIGWIEGKKDKRTKDSNPSIDNAGLATAHEFGTSDGKIPPGRLGFREWADRSHPAIGEQVEKAWGNTIDPGGKAIRELNKLGLWGVVAWQKYLRDVQPGPEWADSTDRAKVKALGQSKAFREKKLIVTSQLIKGATHVVTAKGAKDK